MSTSRATEYHSNVEVPENGNPTSQDQERWTRVKGRLRADVGDDIFLSWFARMDLERIEEHRLPFGPDPIPQSWIQSHYTERMLAAWQAEQAEIMRIELSVRGAVIASNPPKPKPVEQVDANARAAWLGFDGDVRVAFAPVSAGHEALGGSPARSAPDLRHVVIGRSIRLHAAAKRVAMAKRGDVVMFNPLYVHAGVGLGKTHLLQAILGPAIPAPSASALSHRRKFMYGFVSALRTQTALAFKGALRGIDVVVIDDLQFLKASPQANSAIPSMR
jgi:chromosomal replication initiator protein